MVQLKGGVKMEKKYKRWPCILWPVHLKILGEISNKYDVSMAHVVRCSIIALDELINEYDEKYYNYRDIYSYIDFYLWSPEDLEKDYETI